jgi:hypothetical protein
MDRDSIISMFLYRRKRRRDRLRWVHSVIQKKEEFGASYALCDELRDDADKFLNYFRMSLSLFDKLLCRLKESLQRRSSKIEELHSTCRNVG